MTDATSQNALRSTSRVEKAEGLHSSRWGAVALFALAYIGAMVLIAAPRGIFLSTPEELAVQSQPLSQNRGARP